MVHCSFCCQFFRTTSSFYLWVLPKIQVAGFPFTFWCSSIFRTFLNIRFPKQSPAYWRLFVTQSVAVMWQLHIICRWWEMRTFEGVLFGRASHAQPEQQSHEHLVLQEHGALYRLYSPDAQSRTRHCTSAFHWCLQGPSHQLVQYDSQLIKPLVLDGLCTNGNVPGHDTAANASLRPRSHLGKFPGPLDCCFPVNS